MAPPKMLRPEQVDSHYYRIFKLLVPSWPECLDEDSEDDQVVDDQVVYVGSYGFPPGLFKLPFDKEDSRSFGISTDAWVGCNGKVYLCDMAHLHRVVVFSPGGNEVDGSTGPRFLRKTATGGCPLPFIRAGAVIGVDGGEKIVVKDMTGLHFFDAESDKFLYSSEYMMEPYGLAVLKSGDLVTVLEKRCELVIVGVSTGEVIRVVRLGDEMCADLTRLTVDGRSTTRIRFMCASVRKDGVEAVYIIDDLGCRIYCVRVADGEVIWKTTVKEHGRPKGVVALPNGKILVGMYESDMLAFFSEEGTFKGRLFTTPRVFKPQGMYLRDQEGTTSLLVCFGNKVATNQPAVHEFRLPASLLT